MTYDAKIEINPRSARMGQEASVEREAKRLSITVMLPRILVPVRELLNYSRNALRLMGRMRYEYFKVMNLMIRISHGSGVWACIYPAMPVRRCTTNLN